MSEVTAIHVTMPAAGTFGEPNMWGEYHVADCVEWRASVGPRGLVVSVTAYTPTHANKTWMNPNHFVADGLDSSEPPRWVPDAPRWFWDAVEAMRPSLLASASGRA